MIADMIQPRSRVLDVGCGDGTLLDYLVQFKQVDGRGIERDDARDPAQDVGHQRGAHLGVDEDRVHPAASGEVASSTEVGTSGRSGAR